MESYQIEVQPARESGSGGEANQDTMNNYFVSEVHKRLCSHELVTHKKYKTLHESEASRK